ncbi:substrate-binding periplasmic protein [Aquipseudomonas alcaligenes]|uniref:substrate-binding periplasmic protein n=1 Tax=Aquipseudomonas alcaligenes TaxID=43263 RepID=UPI003747BFEE
MVMTHRSWLYGCALLLGCWCTAGNAQPLRSGGTLWPPFSYEDAHGNARGIAVDIASQVAMQNDLQLQFLFYPTRRLNLLLDNGSLDLNYADSPLWNGPQADQRFVYSQPYLTVREYLYFRTDHPARLQPLEQLNGLRIGTVRGYSYPLLDQAMASGRLKEVETSDDAVLLDLLLRERVDAIAMVDDVFVNLLAARQIAPTGFTRSAQLSEAPLVIKLQLRHAERLPAVNATLRRMMESGEVQRIRRAYLGNAADVADGR